MRRSCIAICLATMMGAVVTSWSGTFAQDAVDPRPQEYSVKLAFLFNFGRFVSWPAEAFSQVDAPFVLGILGPDPFGGGLERIAAARKLQGRNIVVRHFAVASEYQPCQMLFVTAVVAAADRDEVLRKTATAAVLIVGEADGFAARGAGINLYREQENVRFELNLDALRGHKLQADAKLLSLARMVKSN
jgi:hypothetical protein